MKHLASQRALSVKEKRIGEAIPQNAAIGVPN